MPTLHDYEAAVTRGRERQLAARCNHDEQAERIATLHIDRNLDGLSRLYKTAARALSAKAKARG